MLRNVGWSVLGVLVFPAMILAFTIIAIAMMWLPEWLLGAVIVGVVLVVASFYPAIVRWERREEAKKRLY